MFGTAGCPSPTPAPGGVSPQMFGKCSELLGAPSPVYENTGCDNNDSAIFATPAMHDLPIAALPAPIRGKECKALKFDCNSRKLPMAALPATVTGDEGQWLSQAERSQRQHRANKTE
jgi:hypothetical protein